MLIIQTTSSYIWWPVVGITWCMGWFVDIQLRYNLTWFACSLPDKTKFGRNFEKLNTFYFLALLWLFSSQIYMANDYSSESEEEVYRKKKTKSVKRHRKSRSLVKIILWFIVYCLIFFFGHSTCHFFLFFDVYFMVDIIVTFDFLYCSECVYTAKIFILCNFY